MDQPQPGVAGETSPVDSRFTRSWLERLSTDELIAFADSQGLDFPPGLERNFIIEELLDLAFGDDIETDENLGSHPDFMEAAALPKQYNISFIEVMIRDPLWAFVFWEIKGHDKEIHEKTADFEGYCLRVIPMRKTDGLPKQRAPLFAADRADSFTITVGADDTAWFLGFPPDAAGDDSRCYQVELCVPRGGEAITLAASRLFTLPRLIEPPGRHTGPGALSPGIQDIYRNPLARLSGAGDFSVIRSAERQSRTRV